MYVCMYVCMIHIIMYKYVLYPAQACLSVGCPLAIWGARGAARHAARHAPQMGVKNSCWIEQKTCLNPW